MEGKPTFLNVIPTSQISQQLYKNNNSDNIFKNAEVAGIVKTINFPKNRGDHTTFKIYCPNMRKTFDAVCNLFCPIRQGDTIYAACMIGQNNILHINKPPFVQPAIDKDSIIQCFMRALKQGFKPTIKLYNEISKIAGGDDMVIPFLTGIAQSWNDTYNSDILFMFDGTEPENVKKLLGWWHKERNLRRLYLFGLTKKEINACRMTCDDIYLKCMDNPYTVPAIPLEKCDSILDRLNKRPNNEDRIRGAIIRSLWKNLHINGWTGTPTHILTKEFPNIKEHVEELKINYGMVAELRTAYLTFPHKVETWIADFIINKHKEDFIEYDTPLDQTITLDNGDIIERIGAHFVGDKFLSEDQKRAIQGALDHTICIIKGAAGTGKCLDPKTKILMFDGSIKTIENINVGESIMGPDSKQRIVLSTCVGTDDMFEIIPNCGKSFICNFPHVLTLKGNDPYLDNNNNVSYTIKGIKHNKLFGDKTQALKFMETLSDDIYDIPLNEYISRNRKDQENSHLFHVAVEFDEKLTPIDPYDMGFNLGFNLLGEIPDVYIINSKRTRLLLLAGFIDAIPIKYICECCIQFKLDNNKILNNLEYVISSLGFIIQRTNDKILIVGCIDNIPLRKWNKIIRSVYKQLTSRPNTHTCKQFLNDLTYTKFSIKSLGKGKYCGFELDNDGRFLLDDFLVTHNTTCLNQIIHNLELRGVSYAVCSFTGKAVARIREVTKKRNPSTMHRLVYNAKMAKSFKRSTQFEKEIPLEEYEHIVIDEISMVTTELLYDFLQAYPSTKKLTLIGDVNQLQPIGWGCLLHQLLKSETIPTYSLTTNYRVYTSDGDRDGIILNANAIVNHDPIYPFEFVATNNFSLFEGPIERVYDIIKGCFSSGVKAEQLVILTPYNRSLQILNQNFQNIYNTGARFVIDSRGIKWMIGDRVMLIENNQEIGVFNGESGTIVDITDKAILVNFGCSGKHEFLLEPTQRINNFYNNNVSSYYYRGEQIDEVLDENYTYDNERTVMLLVHAYALSIDKSQGSEWDFVILYIPEFNTGSFLNKNRIYTAITRSKRCVWTVVTDIDAFNIVAVKPPPFRCDNLSRRLIDKLPNLKPFKIATHNHALEMKDDMKNDIIPEDAIDMGFDCDDFD